MTQPNFISLWQSDAPDIKAEALKFHIRADLVLRRRFRIAILTAQTIPVLIALWMDIQGFINWRWLASFITLAALAVQVYKMERARHNRHIPLDLTPRAALEAALRQNKINIRNAWIFSDVIPLSGLMGGLIGALFSRLLINRDIFLRSDTTANNTLIVFLLIAFMLTALLICRIIGKQVWRQKKAERAILRKRLILLDDALA